MIEYNAYWTYKYNCILYKPNEVELLIIERHGYDISIFKELLNDILFIRQHLNPSMTVDKERLGYKISGQHSSNLRAQSACLLRIFRQHCLAGSWGLAPRTCTCPFLSAHLLQAAGCRWAHVYKKKFASALENNGKRNNSR